LEYDAFIRRYNKERKDGVREGRATEAHVEAFEKRMDFKLADFEDKDYKFLADEFEAQRGFLGDYMERQEVTVDVSQISSARLGIPFGSQWYSLETCELVEVENGQPRDGLSEDFEQTRPRNTLGQITEFSNYDAEANSWILVYGGKATPYTPTAEALNDLVGLSLPDYEMQELKNPVPKPSDEVVAFFQKYGPLGLFFFIPLRFEPYGWVRLRQERRSKFYKGLPNDVMFIEEYSKLFYQGDFGYAKGNIEGLAALEKLVTKMRKSKSVEDTEEGQRQTLRAESKPLDRVHTKHAPSVNESFFQGYFEDWLLVYEQLRSMRQIWTEWSKNGNIDPLNSCLRGNVEVQLSGEESVSWSFYFPTLRDAFFGLMAKETIRGKQWRECQNCGTDFWPSHGNTKYCTPKCRQAFNDDKRPRNKV